LKGRYIVKNFNVTYIKERVDTGLSTYPQFKDEVVKVLLKLLEIRELGDYIIKSLYILDDMRKMLLKREDVKKPDILELHEIAKSAIGIFPKLTGDEKKAIEKYLKDLILKEGDTLELYMSKELRPYFVETKELTDKLDLEVRGLQIALSVKTGLQKGIKENFELSLVKATPDSEVSRVITGYYENKGCKVINDRWDCFYVTKEGKAILIVISWVDEILQVTVNDCGCC
jgi:hypothetical protein|tara:strand:- start:17640 stop:18326 length:687 start_codon:yes stop_codon:yes gene_type:complete